MVSLSYPHDVLWSTPKPQVLPFLGYWTSPNVLARLKKGRVVGWPREHQIPQATRISGTEESLHCAHCSMTLPSCCLLSQSSTLYICSPAGKGTPGHLSGAHLQIPSQTPELVVVVQGQYLQGGNLIMFVPSPLFPTEAEAKCYCTSQDSQAVCSAYLGDNTLSTCQELQLMRHRTEAAKCSNCCAPSFQTLIAVPCREEHTKN